MLFPSRASGGDVRGVPYRLLPGAAFAIVRPIAASMIAAGGRISRMMFFDSCSASARLRQGASKRTGEALTRRCPFSPKPVIAERRDQIHHKPD
jgi:hypothetical protein